MYFRYNIKVHNRVLICFDENTNNYRFLFDSPAKLLKFHQTVGNETQGTVCHQTRQSSTFSLDHFILKCYNLTTLQMSQIHLAANNQIDL